MKSSPGTPAGDGLAEGVEQVDLGVGDGPADGRCPGGQVPGGTGPLVVTTAFSVGP